jgi:hypothetical protein
MAASLYTESNIFHVNILRASSRSADKYTNRGDYRKAIELREEFKAKSALVYGEMHPFHVRCIFNLACDYFSVGDVKAAISHHENCLTKRRILFGDAHPSTLESVAALTRATNFGCKDLSQDEEISGPLNAAENSEEVYYNSLRIKDLIQLIDSRQLSRAGLSEKIELVQLLVKDKGNASISPVGIERRGVGLKLFSAVRSLALSINPDVNYWSIGRVSAIINGNHEILKPNCRWERVDAPSTLTYAGKCSLIEVLRRSYFSSQDRKHPRLGLSYQDVVGEKATIFLSFAYNDNYIDLVGSLERFFVERLEYNQETTFFWFDLFINDQWAAASMGFDWWLNTFKKVIEEIGHTICFLSPWSNPTIIKPRLVFIRDKLQ